MNTIIIYCAKYLFVLVVLGLGVIWLRANNPTKKRLLVATIFAGIIALVIAKIGAHLYYDPRPFVSEHVKPLISHAPDNGFPSDHALLTMTLTAVAFFYSRKIASLMLVFTIIVGVARILAKVHSPLDISAGWVIGIIGAYLGQYLMRWAFKTYSHRTPQPE